MPNLKDEGSFLLALPFRKQLVGTKLWGCVGWGLLYSTGAVSWQSGSTRLGKFSGTHIMSCFNRSFRGFGEFCWFFCSYLVFCFNSVNTGKRRGFHALLLVITGKKTRFFMHYFSPGSSLCRLFLEHLPFFMTVPHRRSQNSYFQTSKVTILCFRVKLACQVLQATMEKR